MEEKVFETDGMRNGEWIFCPMNTIRDCPYCDENCHCHINDPVKDCDDFGFFWESWEDYDNA